MQPKFMTLDAIESIYGNFDEAKLHYMEGDRNWFEMRLSKINGLRDSRFEFDDIELDFGQGEGTEEEYAATDCENIKRLYGTLKELPLTTAVDQRFWAGLAHVECWDYIHYRRRKEIASADDAAIKTSFFFTRGVKRSAHIHCLSRLWWAGRIAYDESNREDPYALVSILAGNAFASRILLFSSSNLTANKDISLGILDAIKEQSDAGIVLKREHFVGATKYLNRMGAITVLDYLKRDKVKSLIADYFATDDFAKLRV